MGRIWTMRMEFFKEGGADETTVVDITLGALTKEKGKEKAEERKSCVGCRLC